MKPEGVDRGTAQGRPGAQPPRQWTTRCPTERPGAPVGGGVSGTPARCAPSQRAPCRFGGDERGAAEAEVRNGYEEGFVTDLNGP